MAPRTGGDARAGPDGMERDAPKRKKKQRTGNNNGGKRSHLLRILDHGVRNFRSLTHEPGQRTLRDFAIALHCTPKGVRLRWEASSGCSTEVSDIVDAFEQLILWKDLIPPEKREQGDDKFRAYVEAKRRAHEQVTGVPVLAHRVLLFIHK